MRLEPSELGQVSPEMSRTDLEIGLELPADKVVSRI